MKRFPLIIIALTAAIVVGSIFLASKKDNPEASLPLTANLEYYWGDGCPHCQNVADFLATWDKKDKVTINKYEVWSNSQNAAALKKRYEYCQTPAAEMGVPLLFTPEGKCYSGDVKIINYLKNIEL